MSGAATCRPPLKAGPRACASLEAQGEAGWGSERERMKTTLREAGGTGPAWGAASTTLFIDAGCRWLAQQPPVSFLMASL